MRHMVLFALWASGITASAQADKNLPPWTQLSLSTCGVDTFHSKNPELDGRGTVIAVLDSGVDMGVPGLTHTPLGEIKVVDVRDFTGEGDVSLEKITYDAERGKFVHYSDDGSPQEYTLAEAGKHAPGTEYWFGVCSEANLANSAVADINDNGTEDDEFGILVVATPRTNDDDAIVYIDTNSDRDWGDEQPLQNYHVNLDSFHFSRSKKEKQIAPLTCGLNVYLQEKKVVIHFDDGGHGTHVAGIAAGYRINAQRDFHGVAPGAKIISLKIGNNKLAGGSTTTGSKKKAFEYAARYAREHDVPVICNLSYGIGSEKEGHSDIDKFLDGLCKANPELIVFCGAGNEGPGLSTIGTPVAAQAAISVAALLAADSARDVIGLKMEMPQIAVFSSRGGELSKPTIIVPGYATSTVPRWNRRGDFWRGTSMASPYATGMAAIMASAANQRYPDSEHRSSWIKAALQNSARPMAGYNALDYGAGIPDMTRAVETYLQMVSTLRGDVLFDFEINTTSPLAVDGSGPTAYWRTPYYPNDRSQVFTITPRFVPTFDAETVASFSRQYVVESDADWCIPRQKQVYFRSEQSAKAHVDYNVSKLTQPGIYVGTIRGVADGQVGFCLINTVIVPYMFGTHNQYKIHLEDQAVDGWRLKRHFIAVPPGASAMHVKLRAPQGRQSEARAREMFRPNGKALGSYSLYLDTKNQRNEATWTVTRDLEPGVWEICTYSRRPDETSYYDLEVRFSGVYGDPPLITEWKHPTGELPSGKLTLMQLFELPIPYKAHGQIEGYQVRFSEELTPEEDVASRSIKFNPEIKAVRIECEFTDTDFAKFTDVPINVFDSHGTAITKDGMSYRQVSLTVDNPDPTAESVECNLEVQPAFALADGEDAATAEVTLTYLYKEAIDITVKGGTLYPGVGEKLKFKLAAAPPQAPENTTTVGYIKVINTGSGDEVISIPIEKQ